MVDYLKGVVDRLLHSSQRLFVLLLTGALMVAGALLGTPGEFPVTADGSYLTPDAMLTLLAPLGLMLTTIIFLFNAIDTRVNSGDIEPNDILALLRLNDFWVALVGIVAGILQVFGVNFLQDAGSQAAAVNMIMAAVTLFLRDNAQRPSGMVVQTLMGGEKEITPSQRKRRYQARHLVDTTGMMDR